MSALGAFCNQLVAFMEDLVETYPEERDIATATQFLKMTKQANPRLIHTYFMKFIDGEVAERILQEDEDYLITKAHELLNSQYAEYAFAFLIFDKHWKDMSETNKDHVWRYIKSIVILGKKVPVA